MKSINSLSHCSEKPQQLRKHRSGWTRKNIFLSVPLSISVSMETGDRWRCCHGDRQGVHALVFLCMWMSLHTYPAPPGSEPCELLPEASDTSRAALFLLPMAKRWQVWRQTARDGRLKDKRQTRRGQKQRRADSRRIIIYCRGRLKPLKINVQSNRALLPDKRDCVAFSHLWSYSAATLRTISAYQRWVILKSAS